MSTKACEIILGQRFRVKYSKSMDEYMCDRSFVMKMPWLEKRRHPPCHCLLYLGTLDRLRANRIRVGAMQEGFGLDPRISVAVLGVTCFATIFGGLKRISAVMEKSFLLWLCSIFLEGWGFF